MKTLIDTLDRLAPPPWLLLVFAALLAASLLAAFVDTLQDNLRQRQQLDQLARVGALRQTMSTAADAVVQAPQPQLR